MRTLSKISEVQYIDFIVEVDPHFSRAVYA